MKKIQIFGGGTFSHVRAHFALAAPAFGTTAWILDGLAEEMAPQMESVLHLTKMASLTSQMATNEDVKERALEVINDPDTKIVFFGAAMVDYSGQVRDKFGALTNSGKYAPRLGKDDKQVSVVATKIEDKVVNLFRKERKDIFLVSFKTTSGASNAEMYLSGLRLLKESSSNLTLVNDVVTRKNMIVTPEEAAYHETTNRLEVLQALMDMALKRSQLTFTQSTVISGDPIPWDSLLVPQSLRTVVDYCVSSRAYKVFNGATVGHFAHKVNDNTFLTSIRKSDFNKLYETGLVMVKTDGPDTILAYGAKPSVGGQSQRRVFNEHEGMDSIVHFHCPMREDARDQIPVRSQREVECGSHECGKNTSDGLATFGNLKAVYLNNHGPNIVFNSEIDPYEVIDFIEANFDLEQKTGGYNLK